MSMLSSVGLTQHTCELEHFSLRSENQGTFVTLPWTLGVSCIPRYFTKIAKPWYRIIDERHIKAHKYHN